MNISDSEIEREQDTIFYLYIKALRTIYKLLSENECKYKDFHELFQKIEEYQNKLDKEYLDEINIRVNNLISGSIFTRQNNFFIYFNQNFFFSTEEDRKEELELISQKQNDYVQFNSKIISHQSIYNDTTNIKKTLISNFKYMIKFLHYEQYLLWFKDYLTLYEKSLNSLLNNNKYIPITWKYYLGIMAVSTMKNEFLLRTLEEEFLDNGGDINWLIIGIDVVPNKLKKLSNFNDILCHQPWNLNEEIVKNLKENMNFCELTEATLILIEFHKLCLIQELFEIKIQNESNVSSDNSIMTNCSSKNLDIKNEILDNVDMKVQDEIIKSSEEIEKEEENILKNKSSNFLSYEICNQKQISFNSFDLNKESEQKNDFFIEKIIKKHTTSELDKIAFKGPNNNITLTYYEYNWNDSGYYILKNFCPILIDCINNEFIYIISLTSNDLKKESPLSSIHVKRAIKVYIEKLFGIYHEDYNYKYITKLLTGNIKITKFIKKFLCFPKCVVESDFQEINKIFLHEEIIHIILLIAILKSRIQLTYYSKIINEVSKCNE